MYGTMLQAQLLVFNAFGPCANEATYAIIGTLLVEILILLLIYILFRIRRWYFYVRVNQRVFHNGESPYEMCSIPIQPQGEHYVIN